MLERLGIKLLWFDSLGAKSASVYMETSIGGMVIDPGAAAMQPSYPLPDTEKKKLREKAIKRIESACKKAKVIVITHYHYDHHLPPSTRELRNPYDMYLNGKSLILKNPNAYINESQWKRSRIFLNEILSLIRENLESYMTTPQFTDFPDPVEELQYAMKRDFGSYTTRRSELLRRGRDWFRKLVEKYWSNKPWIKDNITLKDGTKIIWGNGKRIELGDTIIQVLRPWFHGIEYDRTGWVTPLLIVKRNYRVFYTSDLMGPQIEDYAYTIVDIKPDILIADGPPTYLFPYMLNRVNLNRAIENMKYIIKEAQPKLIIYDHHLLREKRWRERVKAVFELAVREGVKVVTAAEYLGFKPLIDTLYF